MASHKIQKANGAAPADETELSIAQALVDLQSNIPELKQLYITAAKEVIIRHYSLTLLVLTVNDCRSSLVPVRRLLSFSFPFLWSRASTRFNNSKWWTYTYKQAETNL